MYAYSKQKIKERGFNMNKKLLLSIILFSIVCFFNCNDMKAASMDPGYQIKRVQSSYTDTSGNYYEKFPQYESFFIPYFFIPKNPNEDISTDYSPGDEDTFITPEYSKANNIKWYKYENYGSAEIDDNGYLTITSFANDPYNTGNEKYYLYYGHVRCELTTDSGEIMKSDWVSVLVWFFYDPNPRETMTADPTIVDPLPPIMNKTPAITPIKFTDYEISSNRKTLEVFFSAKPDKVIAVNNKGTKVKKITLGRTTKITFDKAMEIGSKITITATKDGNSVSDIYTVKADSTTPSLPTLSLSLKKLAKNKVKLTWKSKSGSSLKKRNDLAGYQIKYWWKKSKKTSKKYTRKIKKYSKITTIFKKLKKNRKYYFKIRAYKKNSLNINYGKWSKTKTVKIKK